MSAAGKVCLVTGASSGIGRRTALDLASDGADVCVTARREDRLKSLVDDMGGEDRGHSYLATDVSDRDQVAELARAIEARYGRLDVLVNNAGFSNERPFHEDGFVEDLDPQTALVNDPILKYALGTEEDVSGAIRDAIKGRKMERVVPRWYYLLQLPRLITPPLYRLLQRKMVLPRQRAMEKKS